MQTISMRSFSGILTVRLATSIETRNVRFFTFVFSIKFRKSVVSYKVTSQKRRKIQYAPFSVK